MSAAGTPDAPSTSRRSDWSRAATGALLGAMIAVAAGELNLDGVVQGSDHLLLIGALLGVVLGATRYRVVLWGLASAVMVALLVVCYTPLMPVLMHRWVSGDAERAAPAVVVLASGVRHDGTLSTTAQDRILRGYELLRRGYAARLVLTRPANDDSDSWVRGVRLQMQTLGLDYPIDVVGPVLNTHDEALAVARLARERGWDHVILVTQAWHMRRAAAVFVTAGLPVVRCPAGDSRYEWEGLPTPGDRTRALGDWLHETVAYVTYAGRGWI